MTFSDMQAAALQAFEVRTAAAREANKLHPTKNAASDWPTYCAALRSLPPVGATFGDLLIVAIVPQNRSTYRRPHTRLIYRLRGKVVTEQVAAAGASGEEAGP